MDYRYEVTKSYRTGVLKGTEDKFKTNITFKAGEIVESPRGRFIVMEVIDYLPQVPKNLEKLWK